MTSQAAALQSYNNDLVKALESLTDRRDHLDADIQRDRLQKNKLENQLRSLKEQLRSLESQIDTKEAEKKSMDDTLVSAEHAYAQILTTSQTLLNTLQAKMDNPWTTVT